MEDLSWTGVLSVLNPLLLAALAAMLLAGIGQVLLSALGISGVQGDGAATATRGPADYAGLAARFAFLLGVAVIAAYVVIGILIGMPLGIISAYKQYSALDQGATFFSMVGFSIPTFFTGTMAIIIFSVWTPTDAWWW